MDKRSFTVIHPTDGHEIHFGDMVEVSPQAVYAASEYWRRHAQAQAKGCDVVATEEEQAAIAEVRAAVDAGLNKLVEQGELPAGL